MTKKDKNMDPGSRRQTHFPFSSFMDVPVAEARGEAYAGPESRSLSYFVHPEVYQDTLLCPICHGVPLKPVLTECEHIYWYYNDDNFIFNLYSEADLLEWLNGNDTCPVDKKKLDFNKIVKPGRIIMNMIKDALVYCDNKEIGCNWTGPLEQLQSHLDV